MPGTTAFGGATGSVSYDLTGPRRDGFGRSTREGGVSGALATIRVETPPTFQQADDDVVDTRSGRYFHVLVTATPVLMSTSHEPPGERGSRTSYLR